jgi:hypothetical protein
MALSVFVVYAFLNHALDFAHETHLPKLFSILLCPQNKKILPGSIAAAARFFN